MATKGPISKVWTDQLHSQQRKQPPNHNEPSRTLEVPAPQQPSPTAHSKSLHLPLSENPLPGPGLLFKVCPGIAGMGAMQLGTPNPHSVISGRAPQEVAPKKFSHAAPTSGALNPLRGKPRVADGANPVHGNPGPVTANPRSPGRTCSRYASRGGRRLLPTPSPSWTQRGVGAGVCDGATASPTGPRPARLPRSPPPPTQRLFGLRRRRWNSNRSGRHLSRRFFLRKRGGATEARAVKPTGLAGRPGREALAGRHLN